jgi:hypothetical protein
MPPAAESFQKKMSHRLFPARASLSNRSTTSRFARMRRHDAVSQSTVRCAAGRPSPFSTRRRTWPGGTNSWRSSTGRPATASKACRPDCGPGSRSVVAAADRVNRGRHTADAKSAAAPMMARYAGSLGSAAVNSTATPGIGQCVMVSVTNPSTVTACPYKKRAARPGIPPASTWQLALHGAGRSYDPLLAPTCIPGAVF